MSFVTSITKAIFDFIFGIIQAIVASLITVVIGIFGDDFFTPGTDILSTLMGDLFYSRIVLTMKIVGASVALVSFVVGTIKRTTAGLYDADNNIVEDILRLAVSIFLIVGIIDLSNELFTSLNTMWEKTMGQYNEEMALKNTWENLGDVANNIGASADGANLGQIAAAGLLSAAIIQVVEIWIPGICLIVIDLFILFGTIKLLISSVTRLATLDCIVLLSPISCGFMTSRSGSKVFSQTAKVILVNATAVAITKAWVYAIPVMMPKATSITSVLFVLCWIKVGTEIERLMKEMGLSSAVMLGDLGRDMLGSIRDAMLIGRGMSGVGRSIGGVIAASGALHGDIGGMKLGDALMGGLPGIVGLSGGAGGNAAAIDSMIKHSGGHIQATPDVMNLAKQAALDGDGRRLSALANAIDGDSQNFLNQAISDAYGEDIAKAMDMDAKDLALDNLDIDANGNISGTMADPLGEEGGVPFKIDSNAISSNGFYNSEKSCEGNLAGSYLHVGNSDIGGEGVPIGPVSADGFNAALLSAGIDPRQMSSADREAFVEKCNSGATSVYRDQSTGASFVKQGENYIMKQQGNKSYYRGTTTEGRALTKGDFTGDLKGMIPGAVTKVTKNRGVDGSWTVTHTRKGRKYQTEVKNAFLHSPGNNTIFGDMKIGHYYCGKTKEIANNNN